MATNEVRIFPLGDNALTVEFGTTILRSLNDRAIGLAKLLEQDPFCGFIEAVPAYASTTVFYDPAAVRAIAQDNQSAFRKVREHIAHALSVITAVAAINGRTIEIPVHFDDESALDLGFVAETNGLSRQAAIDIFTQRAYRVFMLGFLPGFAYMGELDDRIATPRKIAPRSSVPAGSVGIAGRQTGIYSLKSPGGWQIIGRTYVELFTPRAEEATYLRPGDEVRFISAE